MQPESRFYLSQRLKLHYLVWGDESNPPLILVHGTRDHAHSWDRTAEALAARYCVYAPDLRGHGDSAWAVGGNYSIIDYGLDMHALGEAIGRAPYTIIAHSLGGGVTLQYAGTFPEKVERIITIEGLGGMVWAERARKPAHVRMREWVESMRQLEHRELHVYPGLPEATERMLEANKHLSPELAHRLTETGVRSADGGYVWKFDNYTHAGSPYEFNMEDARDLWNQIRCPVLIIWGEESWGARFNSMDLSAFHNYRTERVANAGHWVHHDQFDVFMGLVNEFLADD
ncbi:MAG TPA: alpha/beta hydrolase [Tepidiformaceae bacterium]|jgi:pimeloyl-ACP methyl ester carboxylesterase|nr:alpha/beta hydrolase [Tepidiformaceae bacterium]